FRHSAIALGTIGRVAGTPVTAFEERLGLVSAAYIITPGDSVPGQVLFPSDGRFPAPPPDRPIASTRHTADLMVGPLFTYELGRILTPVQTRVEFQPDLRYNPWPGGRLRAAMVFPIHDSFAQVDPEHPDTKRVRSGPITLDQYAWSPGAALFSGTVGVLGNDRYGLSMGAARPIRSGEM